MWRLPPAEVDDCEAAHTRSLWFGVIPTFSPDHWVDAKGKADQSWTTTPSTRFCAM